jgi:hypothetical protein
MYLAAFAVAAVVTLAISAQAPTLPELAAVAGKKELRLGRVRDIEPRSIRELAESSDLIAEATLTKFRSYLSSTEKDIYTDFVTEPIHVVARRATMAAPQRNPGQSPRLIMTLFGGEIDIKSVRVTMADYNRIEITPGLHVLAFLRRSPSDTASEERYTPVHEIAGLLRIDDGVVKTIIRSQEAHEFAIHSLDEALTTAARFGPR